MPSSTISLDMSNVNTFKNTAAEIVTGGLEQLPKHHLASKTAPNKPNPPSSSSSTAYVALNHTEMEVNTSKRGLVHEYHQQPSSAPAQHYEPFTPPPLYAPNTYGGMNTYTTTQVRL